MPNLSPNKTPMPVQDPKVRARNFEEVALGYSEEQALTEAERCLKCKNPLCVQGCPVRINIPAFIEQIRQKNYEEAYRILSLSSALPAVAGRVCPQETQCEQKCVRGLKGEPVAIGRLERFVADWHRTHTAETPSVAEKNGKRVAVVGSGPAGLTCAGQLAQKGYEVTVLEALHVAGGVLMYGIPEFRLPKAIVQDEINRLKASGVRIETNTVVGKTVTVDELLESGFDAVFLGSGAGLPRFLGIPGEGLNGVYSANEFLTRSNLMKAYLPDSDTPIYRGRKVVVAGGGNVAMDAARTALRLGAEEVTIVYRRSMEELPARKEEVEHALEEGIRFRMLTNPCELLGDENGFVRSVRCDCMELGEPDESRRRSPVKIEGKEERIEADCVIVAIGTGPNPLISSTTPGLILTKRGGIQADDCGKTSHEKVYAGGDAVTGAATVILAMGAGKTAAEAIDEELRGK